MVVGISPVYVNLTRRFIQNVGPKSVAKVSEDTGITPAQLEAFGKTGELDPLEVMKIWGCVFSDMSFLQASAAMDGQDFAPLRS